MLAPQNLLADVPADLRDELVQTVVRGTGVRVERIVSIGHASPEGFWYRQDESEWVLLVSGAARLGFEGGEAVEMAAGSFINIAAHVRHRVEWTEASEPTIWLVIYYSGEGGG